MKLPGFGTAALVLVLGCLATLATAQTPEWTMSSDTEGHLSVRCADAGCDGHVQVPQLRVAAEDAASAAHLDIRFSPEDMAFVLEASDGARVRVGGVDLAAQEARVAALEAENAALRSTQARMQCALIANGTTGIGDATKISTTGAIHVKAFVIGTQHFLAFANYYTGAGSYRTFQLGSPVYVFSPSGGFTLNQTIPTTGAQDWEPFVIGTDHYLAVANTLNTSSYLQNSVIYRWEGSEFVAFQSIPTIGAYDWEHFVIGDEHFLAVANFFATGPKKHRQDSVVYKLVDGLFVVNQSIATIGATGIKQFVIADQHYLAVTNYFSDGSFLQDSVVYLWNGTMFEVHQRIPTVGAQDCEHFEIAGEHFLAVANFYNHSGGYLQESFVFKWDPKTLQFVTFQNISTIGAAEWTYFEIGDKHFLSVANFFNGTSYNGYLQNSIIYRWSGSEFVAHQSIPTIGGRSMEHFVIGDKHYLAVCHALSSNSTTLFPDQDSVIYSWNSHCFV